MAQVQGQPMVRLVPSAPDVFRVMEVNATLTFASGAGPAESVGLVQGPANLTLRAWRRRLPRRPGCPLPRHRRAGSS